MTVWRGIGASALLIVAASAVTWMSTGGDDRWSGSNVTTSTRPPTSTSTPPNPLNTPTSTVADDALFLSEVTEVDPALTVYEKKSGNVALQSLLTDGSAFCAFLRRDRDIDTAMVSVVIGARHVESQTNLPLSVTTFNAVDTVALLTLCPSLESVVPTKDLAKIRALGAELTGSTG